MAGRKLLYFAVDIPDLCGIRTPNTDKGCNQLQKLKITSIPSPRKLLNQKEKTVENCFWLFAAKRRKIAA